MLVLYLSLKLSDKLSLLEFMQSKEVSSKSEVMAALQVCYWEWFYHFKGVCNYVVSNPSVQQSKMYYFV